jgi:hypothetical protein
MKTELITISAPSREKSRPKNPKECENAKPYMVDNGVLDIYHCKRYRGTCYFEPNGGKQFKKICEHVSQ